MILIFVYYEPRFGDCYLNGSASASFGVPDR